jgi:hypothetical protein
MKHAIYLNRWNDLFHCLLAEADDETHRVVQSRFCKSLEEARSMVAKWQNNHIVPDEDVRDNSGVDLDVLFAHIEVDLDDVAVNEVAGVVH